MGFIASWLAFLVVCIASSRLGLIAPKLSLPLITGFLAVGTLAGPYILNLVRLEDLPNLSYTNKFALSFIAFSAGAELYLPELRAAFKKILYQTATLTVFTMVLCLPIIYGLGTGTGLIPWMEPLDTGCRWGVASVFAAIMVTQSPASAIAVVKELKAKGLFTSTMLGIVVLADVVVLLIFTFSVTMTQSACNGDGFSPMTILVTLGCIAAALTIGYVIGKLLIFLMLFKRIPLRYLILPLGLGIFVAAEAVAHYSEHHLPYVLNFEPLLICIAGGYVCTNQSRHRHRFIGLLQQAGPFVFLPFFTLTGASLDLTIMGQAMGFAIIVSLVRGFAFWSGSYTGGLLSGQSRTHNMVMWMALLTQAGVSLGLAAEIAAKFGSWGRAFQTSIISVVLVNQILGPVLFKIAIRRAGEAGKGGNDDEDDEDAIVPNALVVGATPDAVALAARLLKDHRMRVTLIVPTEQDATTARLAVAAWAQTLRKEQEDTKDSVQVLVEAVAKPVASVKSQWKALQDRAAGIVPAVASVTAAAIAGGSASPAPAPAAAPAHQDGHGHVRRLEDYFTAMPLIDTPAGSEDGTLLGAVSHPLLDAEAHAALFGGLASGLGVKARARALSTAIGPAGEGVSPRAWVAPAAAPSAASATSTDGVTVAVGQGVDDRYAKMAAFITTTKHLACVAVVLGDDIPTYATCDVIDTIIAGAPRKSPLHAVRVLATVTDPAWMPAYEEMGVVPLLPFTAMTTTAARLLTAPPNRPIPLLAKPFPNNDELARMVAGLVDNHHCQQWAVEAAAYERERAAGLWTLQQQLHAANAAGGVGLGMNSSSNLAARTGSMVQLAIERIKARREEAKAKAQAAKHSRGLKGVLSAAVEVEEVPEWQREQFRDALGSLYDETGHSSALESGFGGFLTKTVAKGDAVHMFGTVIEESAAETGSAAGSGLAAQDSLGR